MTSNQWSRCCWWQRRVNRMAAKISLHGVDRIMSARHSIRQSATANIVTCALARWILCKSLWICGCVCVPVTERTSWISVHVCMCVRVSGFSALMCVCVCVCARLCFGLTLTCLRDARDAIRLVSSLRHFETRKTTCCCESIISQYYSKIIFWNCNSIASGLSDGPTSQRTSQ